MKIKKMGFRVLSFLVSETLFNVLLASQFLGAFMSAYIVFFQKSPDTSSTIPTLITVLIYVVLAAFWSITIERYIKWRWILYIVMAMVNISLDYARIFKQMYEFHPESFPGVKSMTGVDALYYTVQMLTGFNALTPGTTHAELFITLGMITSYLFTTFVIVMVITLMLRKD